MSEVVFPVPRYVKLTKELQLGKKLLPVGKVVGMRYTNLLEIVEAGKGVFCTGRGQEIDYKPPKKAKKKAQKQIDKSIKSNADGNGDS